MMNTGVQNILTRRILQTLKALKTHFRCQLSQI